MKLSCEIEFLHAGVCSNQFILRPAIILGTCKLHCLVCYLRGSVSSFSYEFFYGVFKVGLNTQQNSPAAHCYAIQNSIIKLNLNSAEIALRKPVSVFSKC